MDREEDRIYDLLDKMDKRLSTIETALINLVRLDEKVSNHSDIIKSIQIKLDDHDSRIRDSELKVGKELAKKSVWAHIATWISGVISALAIYKITKP